MNDFSNPDPLQPLEPLSGTPESEPPLQEPPSRRVSFRQIFGVVGLILAWTAILAAVGSMVALRQLRPAARQGAGGDRLALVVHLIQSRYLVGAYQLIKTLDPKQSAQLYEQSEMLNVGTVDQRLRFVVLAGEMDGPDEALDRLDELEQKSKQAGVALTPEQRDVIAALRQLYRDFAEDKPNAPSVRAEDRERLREELGWFGDLALTPADGDPKQRAAVIAPAWRTAIVFLAVFGLVAVLAFFGLFGLLTLAVLYSVRKLRGGLQVGEDHGGVYAETFAIWILLFVGLTLGASLLDLPSSARLPIQGVAMLASLIAVLWPVLRGRSWSVVRREIGWTAGRRPWLEPLLGPVCYILTLPILGVGLVITLMLIKLVGGLPGLGLLADAAHDFNAPDTAAHPIIGVVASGAWYERLAVFCLASLVAPIVEETMFRGVLYRHLRDASRTVGPWLSVVFSATVVSFIFAVIHPQGLVAVPVLMAMAYGFTIAREWRETLIPAMVAHGLNNGMVLGLLILILGV